jgi:hypothetical protein
MEVYRRIKEKRPYTYVVAAAPSSTGVNDVNLAMDDEKFLRTLYAYRNGAVKNFFDAQGIHPGAAANPPDTLWPEKPGNPIGWNDHPTHYFRHVENVRNIMVEAGLADKQILNLVGQLQTIRLDTSTATKYHSKSRLNSPSMPSAWSTKSIAMKLGVRG